MTNTREIAEQLARDHGPDVDVSTIDAALLDDYGLVDEFTPDEQRDALVEEIHGLIQQMGDGEHAREAVTPKGAGSVVVDCSCGGTYTVPLDGGDPPGTEAEALDSARNRHIDSWNAGVPRAAQAGDTR